MKRTNLLRDSAVCLLVAAFFSLIAGSAFAQEETDAAASMGVGMKSRFASGATPVAIERTKIVPGTPMSVNSTMSKILTSNTGASFGGILARYDTSSFGKFFGSGTMTPRNALSSSRVDALNNLDQSDNEVENIENERMYPARLVLDFNEFPVRLTAPKSTEESSQERAALASQIENVLARLNFDRTREVVRVENVGTRIYLRGKVRTAREAQLLENVLAINYGGDAVVNELIIEEPTKGSNVDLFGRPTE